MLEGYHYQNAYVTRDIEKWIAEFEKRGKVDRILRHEGTTAMTHPDGPTAVTSKLALIWIGDLQYELIQPSTDEDNLYTRALPADDSLRFHHICMRIPDWDEFRARVDQQPFPVAIERNNTEALKFLYLDARPFLGHYLEYVWMTDDIWTRMGGPAI